MKEIKVKEKIELFDFLQKQGLSRKKVKKLLLYKQVTVNGRSLIKYNHILQKGDCVSIHFDMKKNPLKFTILYEDKDLIVVDKKEGILSVSNDKENKNTMFHYVSEYLKQDNKHNKIFVVHRLDRDTSGILLFAKNKKIKCILQENWGEIAIRRNYKAVVEGITQDYGHIQSYIKENRNFKGYSAKTGGKFASTKYVKISSNSLYSFLDISIETGRKNQIRIHMSEMGHPVVGDFKYGSMYNPIHRLCLHADMLRIKHPLTGKVLTFTSQVPKKIMDIIK